MEGDLRDPTERVAVRRHYQAKTAAIIDRYGPGPRVHYHLGFYLRPEQNVTGTAEQIRSRVVTAQERMLDYAASVWDAAAFGERLLDVGCGLGGGAIYWAQHFPLRVTAITNVPEHAAVTSAFAAQAQVADRVRPMTVDVCELSANADYTAAVALESSCYVPRSVLFQRVGAALVPGGVFGIEDVFLTRDAWRDPFDRYWKTQIGTIADYEKAALLHGFEMDRNINVTEQTVPFWVRSAAWARARLAEPQVAAAERKRLARSIQWHGYFHRGWQEGVYQPHLLRFRKTSLRSVCAILPGSVRR